LPNESGFGPLVVYGNEIDSDEPTSLSVQLGNDNAGRYGKLNIRFNNLVDF